MAFSDYLNFTGVNEKIKQTFFCLFICLCFLSLNSIHENFASFQLLMVLNLVLYFKWLSNHTVHMWKKIQEFAGTTFIKQKRLEIVNNWQIDAKKPNASSPFCVNAYFRGLRNFTNFVFSFLFKVRPSSSVVEQWPLDLRLQVRKSLFSILFFTLFCYFQWQTTLNFCEKYTLLNKCDWNAILL